MPFNLNRQCHLSTPILNPQLWHLFKISTIASYYCSVTRQSDLSSTAAQSRSWGAGVESVLAFQVITVISNTPGGIYANILRAYCLPRDTCLIFALLCCAIASRNPSNLSRVKQKCRLKVSLTPMSQNAEAKANLTETKTPDNSQDCEPILCPHCRRTATNGIKCQGICVADSDY
ncbi:MAG: hypothetical protein WA902_07960 [Thermosynechococcaceae cyanobacterium]